MTPTEISSALDQLRSAVRGALRAQTTIRSTTARGVRGASDALGFGMTMDRTFRDYEANLARAGALMLDLAQAGAVVELQQVFSEVHDRQFMERRTQFTPSGSFVAVDTATGSHATVGETDPDAIEARKRWFPTGDNRLPTGAWPEIGGHDEADNRPATADDYEVLAAERASLSTSPVSLDSLEALANEIALLYSATADLRMATWSRMPQELHRLLVSWVTARARAAQASVEEIGKDRVADVERLERVFPRLTNHSKRTKPGTVVGLAYSHRPKFEHWLADARYYETEIDRLITNSLVAEATEATAASDDANK